MKEPQYHRIYADLLAEILNGHLTEGSQLPTEMELSQRYGVSRITSKKALDMLAQEDRIIRIAGKGSFVSSEIGNTFSSKKKTPVIGVVMSGFSSTFGIDFIAGIQDVCKEQNHLAVISKTYTTQEEETAEISHLIAMGARGLILMPVHGEIYNPTILLSLLNKFPMVTADRYLPGLSVPYVGNDNTHASQEAIQYLFRKGHKHVAFFSSMSTTSALQERLDGYINAYAQSDLHLNTDYIFTDIHCTMPGMATENYFQNDLAHIRSFLLENPQITAGLAGDYNTARLLHTVLKQLGKNVPNDFSIICFDQPEDLFRDWNYTHIKQNEYEIGHHAANLLFQIIKNNSPAQDRYTTGYRLIEGESVANLTL